MEKFTWNDLALAISKIDKKYIDTEVYIQIGEESSLRKVVELVTSEDDIYVNIECDEDCGPLEELKELNGDDFELDNYKFSIPKGFPYLCDEF